MCSNILCVVLAVDVSWCFKKIFIQMLLLLWRCFLKKNAEPGARTTLNFNEINRACRGLESKKIY